MPRLGIGHDDTFDLSLLEGFTELTELVIDAGAIEHVEVLATLPKLATLALHSVQALDVSGLQGCKALRTVTLESEEVVLGLEGLGALGPLDELSLNARNASLDGIEGLRVRKLRLDLSHGANLLALGKTEIEELMLESQSVVSLGPLSPSLLKLTLVLSGGTRDRSLPRLPRLRELHLAVSGDVAMVPTAETTPSLEVLTTSATPHGFYGELARLPKLRSVEVDVLSADIEALRGHPSLQSLVAHSPHGMVTSFGAFPAVSLWCGYGGREGVPLRLEHTGLVDLRGIGRFGHVTYLSLRGCVHLATLDGVEALTALEVIDLRECGELTDVSALSPLGSLRVIAAAGVVVADEDFPEAVQWTISRALKPEIETLRRREKPARTKARSARKSPVDDALAEVWAGIELGLRALPVKSDMIADLCRTSGDPSLYNTLLQGVSVNDDQLVLGPRLARGGRTAVKHHLLRRLLAEAPAACTEATLLRDSVTRLRLQGCDEVQRRRWASRGPIDLGPLAAFAALASLSIEDTTGVIGVEALARAPSLRTLHLSWGVHLPDLRALAGASIEHLTLQSNVVSLEGIDQLPLKTLSLRVLQGSLLPLRRCATLESVTVEVIPDAAHWVPLSFFEALPALRSLSVSIAGGDLRGLPAGLTMFEGRDGFVSTAGGEAAEGLRELRGGDLKDCRELPPNLERWTVNFHDGCAVDGAPHTRLTEMTAIIPASMSDLAWVTRFGALRSLTLRGAPPTDVTPLLQLRSLEHVALDAYGTSPDLRGLDAHPTLKTLSAPWARPEQMPVRLRGG